VNELTLDMPESYVAQAFEASASTPWKTLEEILHAIPRPAGMPPLEELFEDGPRRKQFLDSINPLLENQRLDDLRQFLARAPVWDEDDPAVTAYLATKEELPSKLAMRFARAAEECAQAYLDDTGLGGRAILVDIACGSAAFRIRLDGISDNVIAGTVSGIILMILGACVGSAISERENGAALQAEVNRLHHVCIELARRGDVDAVACYSQYADAGKVDAKDIAPLDPPQESLGAYRSVRPKERIIKRTKGVFIKSGSDYIFLESKSKSIYYVVDETPAGNLSTKAEGGDESFEVASGELYFASGMLTIAPSKTTFWVNAIEEVRRPKPRSEEDEPIGPNPPK